MAGKDMTIEIAGQAIPFRHGVSQGGNDIWGVMEADDKGQRHLSKYGVPIAPLAPELPTTVTIRAGKGKLLLSLEAALTQAGAPKVEHDAKVKLPNGEERRVVVRISKPNDRKWNLVAKAIGANGGGRAPIELSAL